MQIEVETITPELAKEYLKGNTNNRSLRAHHVANIARDIVSGNWRLNGDAIRFNCDGQLLDGQHRLSAIVRAGQPVKTVVARGIERSAVVTIDAGAKRTAGDQLSLRGVKGANSTATAVRYAMSMRDSTNFRPGSYTNSEVLDFYQKHRGISENIDAIRKKCPPTFGPMVVAASYAINFDRPGIAGECVESWMYGEGGRDNPCVVARERAIKDALRKDNKLIAQDKLRMVAHSMLCAIKGDRWTLCRIPSQVFIPGWTKS